MTIRLLPPPGVPIGYTRSGRPVYPMIGGSKDAEISVESDDEDEETDEEETDEEDNESEDKDDGKYTPPSRAEWLKVQNSLTRANASAKQRREALTKAEAELARYREAEAKAEADRERKELLESSGRRKGGKSGRSGTEPVVPDGVLTRSQVKYQVTQAEKAAAEKAAAEYHDRLANQAARAALTAEGVQGGGVKKLAKLLNLSRVEFDEDGEVVDGLADQIEELKADFPQLFRAAEPEKPRARRAPVPRVQVADRPAAQDDELRLSTAERMARQVLGSRS